MTDKRVYNFAAGPSTLPVPVLEKVAAQMLNYNGSGMSVMEMSHRSSSYLEIFNQTKALLKKVLNVPDNYKILFIQGGATQQFSTIPLNLMKNGKADYIITGAFSKKSAKEAAKFGDVHIAYDGSANNFKHIPTQDELDLREDASYVHICANNTIYGTEWKYVPDTKGVPIVADMSSNILSKPINVADYGMIYAGAQKNMGIAGCGVIIVREDLIVDHKENIPVLMEYNTIADNDSMYNTPPTFSIYVLGLVLEWIDSLGGLEVMQKRNIEKANLLYDYLDSSDFYKAHSDKDNRSLMNVTFTCPDKDLDAKFVKESIAAGMSNLKGHRSVGGIRASIYNAMPLDGVEVLLEFMKTFEKGEQVTIMYKIKQLNKISEEGLKLLDNQYQMVEDDENAILVRSASLHEYEMKPELQAIARAGAGVNNIPLDKCSEQGIVVFNTPGANANAVKELVLCGLLLSSRKIVEGIEWVKTLEGDDNVAKLVEKGKSQFVGPELEGKKLGIIGLGAIGVHVANAAIKLGMEVYGYDPYISVNAAWGMSKWVKNAQNMETIFSECDYITLHAPSTKETKGIINKDSIALMKDGVRILNYARADLVNSQDVLDAIDVGKIAKYVTDFATPDIVNKNNVIVMPHLGASTPESEDNCARMAVKEIKDYLESGNIVNSVNFPSINEPRTTHYRICLIHKNVPNMLAQFATLLANQQINIENMVNKAKGNYAYTIIETNDIVGIKEFEDLENVIRVRMIDKV